MDLHTLKQLLCPQRQEGCRSSRSAENEAVKTYGEVNEIWKQTSEQVIVKIKWTVLLSMEKDEPGAMGSLVVSLHKIKYSYDEYTNYS